MLPGEPLPCLCMASGEQHPCLHLNGPVGVPVPPGLVAAKPPPLGLTPLIFLGCAQGPGCHPWVGARRHLAPTLSFPVSCVPAGVPGCAGQTHGSGWEQSQAGSVDQCLPGCPGKDPPALGCREGPPTPGSHTALRGTWVGTPGPGCCTGPECTWGHSLASHRAPGCRWMGHQPQGPAQDMPHLPCQGSNPLCCPAPALGPEAREGPWDTVLCLCRGWAWW